MHLTIGHHGWFSLMPVWLLSLVGMAMMRPLDIDPLQRTRGRLRCSASWSVWLCLGFT
jgi:hypothetical protein